MQGNFDSLEPVFFAYILENPTYFHRVEPIAFKNPNIQFIYIRVRDNYISNKNQIIPTNRTIVEIIRLDDPEKRISNDFILSLLNINIGEYERGKDDNWLRNTLQAWCSTTNIKSKYAEAAEYIRDLDATDLGNVEEISGKIREIMNNATLLDFNDDDMGIDFDDPDSHIQDTAKNKIPTGWVNMDVLMNGGWDLKTLNMIIGPSNSGKSLWLGNIACNSANAGKNVLYISLEMADKKVMKRLGASRLRIPIDEYDTVSKDRTFIQRKIKDLKSSSAMFSNSSSDLFENPMGKLFVKEYPAGSAKVSDIEQLVKNYIDLKGVKIDVLVVDYLTIMSPDIQGSSLFQNGKQLSEGLRAIGQKHNLCCISAMQVGKDNFGASDITMSDISESKAIVETCDNMFGIIRTDPMRREGTYILKLLKIRDGEFKWEKTHFTLDKKHLIIEKDKKIDLQM